MRERTDSKKERENQVFPTTENTVDARSIIDNFCFIPVRYIFPFVSCFSSEKKMGKNTRNAKRRRRSVRVEGPSTSSSSESLSGEPAWCRAEASVDRYLCESHPSEEKARKKNSNYWSTVVLAAIGVYFILIATAAIDVPDHTTNSQHDFFEARKATILATLGELQPKLDLEEKRSKHIKRQVVAMSKGQRENPPEAPLVWLLLVSERLRDEARKFGVELAQLARGQLPARIDARTVQSAAEFDRRIRRHMDRDESVVIEHLNAMRASDALGLYEFDDMAEERTKNKTIVLHYETNDIDPRAKTDQVVNDILTSWIKLDSSIELHHNRGLVSRIGANPIILF